MQCSVEHWKQDHKEHNQSYNLVSSEAPIEVAVELTEMLMQVWFLNQAGADAHKSLRATAQPLMMHAMLLYTSGTRCRDGAGQ